MSSISARASRAGAASAPARLIRQIVARFSWGLADQAMSSLTNSAMSIYIARELGATKFGAFSLAYVSYSFALNASRGLATDPLLVRFSGADPRAWKRAVAHCTGTATLVGLLTGACALIAAAALSGTTRMAFLALGITLPGLLLQDSWRYSFFALGRGAQALINDTIWALTMVPALLMLHVTHHQTVFAFILCWGLAATVAASAGPFQAHVMPRLGKGLDWVRCQRDLGPRYLAENTCNSGASQLRLYGVGAVAGLAAVGYVQEAYLLQGPFMVIFMGISLVTVPEAARALRRSPRHLRLYSLAVGAVLAVGALAWGVILLVTLPRGLGFLLLGAGKWQSAYALVTPLTIAVMGAAFISGATAGLHALGAARRSLRAMVLASILYLGLGLAGAVMGGATGTLRGTAIATWAGAVLWWWELHSELRKAGQPGKHRAPQRFRSDRRKDDLGTSAERRAAGLQRRQLPRGVHRGAAGAELR